MVIPAHIAKSPALQFVISRGWEWKEASDGQIAIEECPFCHRKEGKFMMSVMNPEDGTRDGLYMCFHGKCAKTGNMRLLQEHLGVATAHVDGVESRSLWAGKERKPDALPDPDLCHAALLSDAETMDYLINTRGFSREIIDRQKLGFKEKVYFREAGEVRALVIPYLVNGNIVFAKYRTLPPSPKDFVVPTGHDAQLYNGEILVDGLSEILFVEGETNTLICMTHGINNVVGAPGAGVKKASWIETLDRVNPTIYILYDNDNAGKKGSQDLASRIGIEKCLKLVLPEFYVFVAQVDCKRCKGTCEEADVVGNQTHTCDHKRRGKDLNEWFQIGGGTAEKLEELKQHAQFFDVSGVTSSGDALTQLEDELAGKVDLAPTYLSPWAALNSLVGFENGDVIDILAPEKVGKTTLGMNLMDHMCSAYGEDGLIVCLEMTQARLAKKWVAMLTGFEDVLTKPGTPESKAKLAELQAACVVAREIQKARNADLYFAYPLQWQDNPDSIFKLIKDCIRRYGVKWVMFDNLQKFCDESLGKAHQHRTIYLSQLSKRFTSIAKDHNIKLIRILQPRQIEDGQMAQSRHIDGSSQISKDCDCLIMAWRSQLGSTKKSEWESGREEESIASFAPRMKLTVALSRYSSGGQCSVMFDGARSQVKDDLSPRAAQPKVDYNSTIPMDGPAGPIQGVPGITI